jgi:hypothetical protein
MKNIKNVLIAVLIVVIAGYSIKDCSSDPAPPEVTHEIDTVFQEVKVEVPTYVPKWRIKIETVEVHDSIPPQPIDTLSILADYYAKYKTVDTLNLPYPDSVGKTFGYGVITDIISKNAIESRNVIWNYRIPTVTHTITIHPKPKAQVYIGATANVNSLQILSSVSGALLYKTKRDRVYIANIGVADNGAGAQPFLGGGVMWKISFKKPNAADLLLK